MEAKNMIPKTLLVGLAVIAIAYLYGILVEDRKSYLDEIEKSIIDAWREYITLPKKRFQRVAVGINCNLDLIVPALPLFEALHVKPGGKENHPRLDSLQSLQETFHHFFSKGSAAERAFANGSIFKEIVEAAESLQEKQYYIGGNAALMASKIKFLFPDVELQLVGPIGPKLSELFSQSIQIPEESHIEEDEVHLIMEYRVGETWGDSTATVATRFITSFDESNSKMTHLETFFSSLSGFESDLIIMSGLHLMEGEGKDFYTGRLKVFKAGLNKLNPTIPVHLELASMANGDLVQEIFREIIPAISSLGLNEQELSFSSHVLKGPHSDDFIHLTGQPEIHKISDMILWILKTFGYSKERSESKLTRVHFHSLTYHILGTIPDAWSNNEAAVAAGTHMAGRQACDVKHLTPEQVELRIPATFRLYSGGPEKQLDHNHPVIFWDYEGYHFVFSPVLVCRDPQKTVGLGDAISATGLMYSQYNRGNLR